MGVSVIEGVGVGGLVAIGIWVGTIQRDVESNNRHRDNHGVEARVSGLEQKHEIEEAEERVKQETYRGLCRAKQLSKGYCKSADYPYGSNED